MTLFAFVWNHFLYIPLFNFLIWLYNGPAQENLGVAVIMLTVALRMVLLPLSIISARSQARYQVLEKKVQELQKELKNDPEAIKEQVRQLLRQYHINPWAKTMLIAVQGLVLVLLYQVFIGGITRYKMNVLYPSVHQPEVLNTTFYGFQLGVQDWRWAAVVGLVVFLEIYLDQRRRVTGRAEHLYAVFFPIMTFLALWALPMVKSIFILTTLAFSYILSMMGSAFHAEEEKT